MALAIRSVEKVASLDDEPAMLVAFREKPDAESRILLRAHLLGQRLGLLDVIKLWSASKWGYVLAVCAVLFAFISGLHLAHLMVTRTINPVIAVFGALALPTIMLGIWVYSVLREGAGHNFFEWPLVQRIVCWLLRLITTDNRNTADLYYGGLAYLRQNRITGWYFGLVSHALWSAALLTLIVITWLCHSFIGYDIIWQSTLQGADAYVGFVRGIGFLPEQLGFPHIDSIVLNAETTGAARATASLWLLGCIVTYGLFPRVILFALCWIVLRFRKATPSIDFADPYFRALAGRFAGMEAMPVVDVEKPAPGPARTSWSGSGFSSSTRACIGYELPEESGWPPPFAAKGAELLQSIAGAAPERRNTLNALAALWPGRLLIVCDAGASPDRGAERFFQEAQANCGAMALFLVSPQNRSRDDPERWVLWASSLKSGCIPVLLMEAEAETWWEEAIV